MSFPTESLVIFGAIGGGIGLYTAALALGIRHGIDWDHIAAITDLTSASASVSDEKESWLIGEPGVQLTDEHHHHEHGPHVPTTGSLVATSSAAPHAELSGGNAPVSLASASDRTKNASAFQGPAGLLQTHRTALWLGTLYALGHGLVVTLLGVLAILASEILPDWIDPVMERVVGITLIFLGVYLFYSLYRYFRGGGEFRLRSRWMLVFAGVANAWSWIRSRIGQHEHVHVEVRQQYGARTAFGIGMIHGVGAETGTQALIIATAIGATNQTAAMITLLLFVVGLLISNSFVTVASTVGFVSARQRQAVYVAVGFIAAVFSLVVGFVFVTTSTGILPDLDPYFRWIGGP